MDEKNSEYIEPEITMLDHIRFDSASGINKLNKDNKTIYRKGDSEKGGESPAASPRTQSRREL